MKNKIKKSWIVISQTVLVLLRGGDIINEALETEQPESHFLMVCPLAAAEDVVRISYFMTMSLQKVAERTGPKVN